MKFWIGLRNGLIISVVLWGLMGIAWGEETDLDSSSWDFNSDFHITTTGEVETSVVFTHDSKIQWLINDKIILEAEPNGNFYVNGRLTKKDKEVYRMLKEWLEYTWGLLGKE